MLLMWMGSTSGVAVSYLQKAIWKVWPLIAKAHRVLGEGVRHHRQ